MWWLRRLGRARVSGRALRWGTVAFAVLVILGRFGHAPDSGPFPPPRPAAMAEAASARPLAAGQAHHLPHHLPHRVPWWLRPGPGYGQRAGRGTAGDAGLAGLY